MSVTEITPEANPAALKGRLSLRRQELREDKPIDIPVPGFETILVARYQALDYRILRTISLRQQANKDQADAEVKVASDSLVWASQDLLEIMEDGSLRSTGYRWGPDVARNLFGVGEDELPDGASPRDALLKVIDPIQVVLHYAEYDKQVRHVDEEVEDEIQGESEASSAVV